MRQIKLTKDATLISLCSLNYSSTLALNQPASHQRAFLTPLHHHSLALPACTRWLFCEICRRTVAIFVPSPFSKLTFQKREHLWCYGNKEFPLTAAASICIVLVDARARVWDRGREPVLAWVCAHWCTLARIHVARRLQTATSEAAPLTSCSLACCARGDQYDLTSTTHSFET